MVGFYPIRHIVITTDVQVLHLKLGMFSSTCHHVRRNHLCNETGCIKFLHTFNQFTLYTQRFLIRFIRYLITYAPHDDGRMIPVTLNHIGKVWLPGFLEISGIVLRRLMYLPNVGKLFDDQYAQLVAGIQEMGRWWVMRRTYSIVASLFQQFYFAVFRTFEGSGAQQAIIMVHTSAFKLQ